MKNLFLLKAALITVLIAGAAGVSSIEAGSHEVTIVSVDTDRILEVHPAFQEAQAEYQAKMQEMQQELEGMQEEEQMMAQQMMQQELQELGTRLQSEADEAIMEDIREIAQEKGYDYVIDSSALLSGGRDITEEVLEALR